MLKIRLQRIGRKKQPLYRLVVSEHTKDTQAKALEILGQYNPVSKEKGTVFNEDRINYWLGMGAQSSATVHNLLINANIIKGDKKLSVQISSKRKKKMGEKAAQLLEKEKAQKEKEEAVKQAAEEAARQAAQAPEPVQEETVDVAPVEEEKKGVNEPGGEDMAVETVPEVKDEEQSESVSTEGSVEEIVEPKQ